MVRAPQCSHACRAHPKASRGHYALDAKAGQGQSPLDPRNRGAVTSASAP
jgi:hypothetical protein